MEEATFMATLERIATALEQIALEHGPRNPSTSLPSPSAGSLDAALAAVPTYTAPSVENGPIGDTGGGPTFAPIGWLCPEHLVRRIVPAGISSKTGKPYAAFVVCGEQRCDQKPPRVTAARVLP